MLEAWRERRPRPACCRPSGRSGNMHDDLADDRALGHTLQPLFELLESDLAVDYREGLPGRHLVEPFGHIADAGAEGSDDANLLLKEQEEIGLRGDTAGGSTGDEPSAALQREEAARPGVGPHMLEH